MQLEAGKQYLTRDKQKVLIKVDPSALEGEFYQFESDIGYYSVDGRFHPTDEDSRDLVEEV